jgi:outer membrane protein OmpA-like peptidoglycan-associated protein
MRGLSHAFRIIGGGVAAVLLSAGAAQASEPVSASYILGKLVPVTGKESDLRIDLDVRFAINSATLTEAATAQLDQLGQALLAPQLEGARIGIYGHTDASGAADYNMTLSEARAVAVAEYLVGAFAIDPARLEIAGFGKERLKDAANPRAAENRRVEIVNLAPLPVKETTPQAVPPTARPMPESVPSAPPPPPALTPPPRPAGPPIGGGGMQAIN